jgi:O-antigen ligase
VQFRLSTKWRIILKKSTGIGYVVGLVFAIGLVVVPSGGIDPVFLRSALFIAGGLICFPWAVQFYTNKVNRTPFNFYFLGLVVLFLSLLLVSTFLSDAPPVVSVFGWLGRADGLLTWFGAMTLFLVGSALTSEARRLVLYFIFLGSGIAVLISMAQIAGFNPVATAGYGGASSTFGNPNFAGAFLGFISVAAFWMIFDSKQFWLKGLYALLAAGAAVSAWQSTSLQGPVVLVASFIVTFIFFLLFVQGKSRKLTVFLSYVLVTLGVVISVLTLRGLGPLGFMANEATIKIRQVYWETGVNMARNFPLFGVGPDSFQRYNGANRSDTYIETVGPDIVVSAAHNIPIHTAATLGVPAAILWALLLISPMVLLFLRATTNKLELRSNFVVLAVVAIVSGYLIQSLVSIDQISLKMTGWLAAGLLVGVVQENLQNLSLGNLKSGRSKGFGRESSSAPAVVSLGITFLFVMMTVLHFQAISPGNFTVDRAKEMLLSQWVPCQIKYDVVRALDEQGNEDIKNLSFMVGVSRVDERCYEMTTFVVTQALSSTAAPGSPALDESRSIALAFSSLLVELDPKSWRRQLLRADVLRISDEPALAKTALSKAIRLAQLQPGVVDTTIFASLRDALYPTN